MRDLKRLKQEVEGLPASDRQQLLDYLALKSKEGSTSSRHQDRDIEMWCQALSGALSRDLGALGIPTPGPGVLRRMAAPLFEPLRVFMEASNLQTLRVLDRQAIYNLLAKLLVAHAKRTAAHVRAPLSVKFVLSCSNAVPGLFENAFPGYVAAGLAKVVAASINSHHAASELQ